MIGHFKVGHVKVGHFKVGHFKVGHFKVGHFEIGHFMIGHFNPPPPSDAVRKQKKIILEDLSSSVLSLQKISPLWKPEI